MMEYRQLPHGTPEERFSALGIGLGGIQKASDAEIEATVAKAIESGINYFDACGGAANIYKPFGRAIAGRRNKVFFPLHLSSKTLSSATPSSPYAAASRHTSGPTGGRHHSQMPN